MINSCLTNYISENNSQTSILGNKFYVCYDMNVGKLVLFVACVEVERYAHHLKLPQQFKRSDNLI